MVNYKILLDNDVRHLEPCFRSGTVVHLSDVGLDDEASDHALAEAALERGYIVFTNTRRGYVPEDPETAAADIPNKDRDCTKMYGHVVIVPSDKNSQAAAIDRASRQMAFEGRKVSWKQVRDNSLKVVIHDKGKPTVTKMPLCLHCEVVAEAN